MVSQLCYVWTLGLVLRFQCALGCRKIQTLTSFHTPIGPCQQTTLAQGYTNSVQEFQRCTKHALLPVADIAASLTIVDWLAQILDMEKDQCLKILVSNSLFGSISGTSIAFWLLWSKQNNSLRSKSSISCYQTSHCGISSITRRLGHWALGCTKDLRLALTNIHYWHPQFFRYHRSGPKMD